MFCCAHTGLRARYVLLKDIEFKQKGAEIEMYRKKQTPKKQIPASVAARSLQSQRTGQRVTLFHVRYGWWACRLWSNLVLSCFSVQTSWRDVLGSHEPWWWNINSASQTVAWPEWADDPPQEPRTIWDSSLSLKDWEQSPWNQPVLQPGWSAELRMPFVQCCRGWI